MAEENLAESNTEKAAVSQETGAAESPGSTTAAPEPVLTKPEQEYWHQYFTDLLSN